MPKQKVSDKMACSYSSFMQVNAANIKLMASKLRHKKNPRHGQGQKLTTIV
jgi:hypothetical protein